MDGMMIFTDGGEEALEGNGAAEADTGFFVGAFGFNTAERLQKHEVAFVVAEYEYVIVGLVQLRGDGELGFGDVSLGEQRLDLLAGDGSKLDFAGIEFGEQLLQRLFIVLGEFSEAVVGNEIADFLRDDWRSFEARLAHEGRGVVPSAPCRCL